jgi:TPR repeat protein
MQIHKFMLPSVPRITAGDQPLRGPIVWRNKLRSRPRGSSGAAVHNHLRALALAGVAGVAACQQTADSQAYVTSMANSTTSTSSSRENPVYNSNLMRAQRADSAHDYTQAMGWWMKVVTEGDGLPDLPPTDIRSSMNENGHAVSIASAEIKIADYYRNGLGVPKDYTAAAHWYQKASESPTPFSMRAKVELGILYAHGLGVSQDRAKARQLFVQAGTNGSVLDLLDANKLPMDAGALGAKSGQLEAAKAENRQREKDNAVAAVISGMLYPSARPAPSQSKGPSWYECNYGFSSALPSVLKGSAGCSPW